MNEIKKPAIRFKGFSDGWEEQPLGNIFEEYSEKGYTELPPLTIIQGEGTICRDESDRTLFYDKSNLCNYKMVKKGDFIVHLRSFEGGLEIATQTGLVSPAYHIFHGENTDSTFYYSYFRSKKFIDTDLKPHVYGIRDGRSIDIEGMKTINIPYTSYEEQAAIGTLIEKVDSLIALRQHECDKSICLKKSMLERMFPKGGADVPEIRFKDFSKNWKKIKLSQIADKVTTKNTQNLVTETFTNSAEYGIISQLEFFDHDISKADKINGYYIVESNDFVYNPRISVTAPCGPINCNRLGRKGVMSPLYTIFRTHDIDTLFLEWYFKSPYWYSYMRFNGDSGARSDRFSIKTDLFFEMPIPVPSSEEQNKIGQALQTISNNIKLHQQELEKLQSIKKALLEKMFV